MIFDKFIIILNLIKNKTFQILQLINLKNLENLF